MHYKILTQYLSPSIKQLVGGDNGKPLTIGGYPIIVRNFWVSRHNLDHLEVSHLDRIQMGVAQVSGIHEFYSSMYHDYPIEPEYDGMLDEVRVFVHEGVTRPSLLSVVKLLYWSIWLATKGINPILIILRHLVTIRRFRRKLHRFQERDSMLGVGLALHLESSPKTVIRANAIAGFTEVQILALRYQGSSSRVS